MGVLLNIDVPDLDAAVAFYTGAFDLSLGRRLGGGIAELLGWPSPVYLLQKAEGSPGAGSRPRGYARHWTPIHFDVVVDPIEAALDRALLVGATLERGPETAAWGKLAGLSDPFGHGFCLIQFLGRGYDALVVPEAASASRTVRDSGR